MNCRTCDGPCCLKGSNHEGDCEGYKPMSHYDQIRAMSVEEMAETFYNGNCPPSLRSCPDHDDCKKCWLDWLRQEAEHE